MEKFRRRRRLSIPNRGDFYFASPEDLILSKLQWQQSSQSEKQWRDILGILKTQTDQLDIAYLQHWSAQLGVAADLEQAFQESGLIWGKDIRSWGISHGRSPQEIAQNPENLIASA